MTRLFSIVGLLLYGAVPSCSQVHDLPRAELFGGFSYLNADLDDRKHFFGLQGSFTWNLNRTLGITTDLGGQFDTEAIQAYEALWGPRFVVRGEKTTGFVHALAGLAHVRGGGGSGKTFAMGFGGGLDIHANERWAVRLVQFDYIPNREFGAWTQEVRLGTGLVLRFGSGE